MQPQEFVNPHLLSGPQLVVQDLLQSHQTAYQFYSEVRYREALARHCEWYEHTAAEHHRQLKAMRCEINVLQWLRRS